MSEYDAMKEEMLETNDEFRRLYEEHQTCERRLDEINQKSFLSQEDEFEQKRLKRHKLTLKDRMHAMLVGQHQEHRASA
jgi:uncharacterized protein YdcH (DUF465 family)